MAETPLDPQELEAIQQAIREASVSPSRPSSASLEDVTPLALIADDRAAELARPAGLRIGERWANAAARKLRHQVHTDLDISVVNSETVEGGAARDELATMFCCTVEATDRGGRALVALGGPMIESLAARLCGATRDEEASDDDDEDRAPSATALSLFRPTGESLVAALATSWSELQNCVVKVDVDQARVAQSRQALLESDLLVAVTLSVSGGLRGRMRLFAQPKTLVPPAAPIEAIPAAPGAIDDALGGVPVELSVELGRARISIRDLSALQKGAVLPLSQFIDDPLPITVGGVIKAYGRPVVYRGVIAVEVVSAPSRGNAKRSAA